MVLFFFFSEPQNQPILPEKKTTAKGTSTERDSSRQASESDSDSKGSQNKPTIFIHGYSGGRNSFGGMINRFAKTGEGTTSLIATIEGDGTISYQGDYKKDQSNPMIQVLFVENRSTEENQSGWIKKLLLSLKEKYDIQEFNAVGHSMGGVSLVNYITMVGSDPQYPTMDKLVSIAAPLNGLEIGNDGVTDYDLTSTGPKTLTERYQNFMDSRTNIPVDLAVLSIAGDKEDGTKSDGSVSVASALSSKFIFEGQVEDYREMTFTGAKAAHSLLHENTAVDKAVATFLWKEKK